MGERTDEQLLESYLQSHDEEAFAALVGRHINTVYAAARRQVRDPHLAEDVTQTVFIFLAQKGRTIRNRSSLAGWLFKVTLFVARDAIRAKACRLRHEQEVAAMMENRNTVAHPDAQETWQEIGPQVDEAMSRLGEINRAALVLRYLQDKPLEQVAEFLNLTEGAAGKRISRALAKLRKLLARQAGRGGMIPESRLAASMAAGSAEVAPAALAGMVTHASLRILPAVGALHAGAGLKGAIMSTSKAKIAAILMVVLFGVGVPAAIFAVARGKIPFPAAGNSRVALAAGGSGIAPASTNPSEFSSVYGLEEGRIIKRVVDAPPGVRDRYIKTLFGGSDRIKTPVSIFVGWDHDKIVTKWLMGGTDYDLVTFVQSTRRLFPEEVEGSFLNRQLNGDIIFKQDASDDQYCAALAKLLHEEFGIEATVAFRDVPGKVIVARGHWKFTPLANAPAKGKPSDPCLEVFGTYAMNGNARSIGGGVADNAGDVAHEMSQWIHEKFIIEADGVAEKVGIRFYGRSSRDSADRKLVVEHFQEQTGLVCTEESRLVHHLFIEKIRQ